MPTREERERLATNSLLVALNDARTGIGIESLRLVVDRFRVLFRKGPLTHLESGIDEGTVEDGPGTSKIKNLVQKVKMALGSPQGPASSSLSSASSPSPRRNAGPRSACTPESRRRATARLVRLGPWAREIRHADARERPSSLEGQ